MKTWVTAICFLLIFFLGFLAAKPMEVFTAIEQVNRILQDIQTRAHVDRAEDMSK